MNQELNDKAISETVGVILMVAITVILAALVMSLIFGIGVNSLQKAKVVAITVDQSGSDIRVTYMGGTTDPELAYIAITAPNNSVYITISTSGVLATSGTPVRPNVGSGMVLHGAGTADNDHVIVVGHFNDGASLVLLDTYV